MSLRTPGAGELNQRIVIRTYGEEANANGSADPVLGQEQRVWAAVWPVSGALYIGSMQVEANVTHWFVIRTGPEVTAQHVVEWSGHRFRIRRVRPIAKAMQFTIIEAEENGKIL